MRGLRRPGDLETWSLLSSGIHSEPQAPTMHAEALGPTQPRCSSEQKKFPSTWVVACQGGPRLLMAQHVHVIYRATTPVTTHPLLLGAP